MSVIVVLGHLAVEFGVAQPALSKHLRSPAAEVLQNAPAPSESFYLRVIEDYSQIPAVCKAGEAASDFRKSQCARMWGHFAVEASVAASPFFLAGLLLFLALDQLSMTYRRARRRMHKPAYAVAVVTNPAVARNDLYGWFHCFQTVAVELPNRKQLKIYIPMTETLPEPGQKLAVYDLGEIYGAKRFVAAVYAPYIAVIQGS